MPARVFDAVRKGRGGNANEEEGIQKERDGDGVDGTRVSLLPSFAQMDVLNLRAFCVRGIRAGGGDVAKDVDGEGEGEDGIGWHTNSNI